ncbi:MAG: T9SS C-terminal target domain-containing protein [Bacteroidetes bacterium]|nr:MAG: T9SS C-terminal target domain-containing protein [Bacteroidota bacterium]
MMKKWILLGWWVLLGGMASAQITVDIHPNFRHSVAGVDSFNRKRMVKIHADQVEPDWDTGNNFGYNADLRDTFLNGLDVYMGRNTGPISWHVNQVAEDPARPGFADPADIAARGEAVRNEYASRTNLHPYEARNELVIAAQQTPFFPDGTQTRQGWAFANGTATGEFMGRYINEFHGRNGPPEPPLVEIMNEPVYMFVTRGTHTPAEVFNFHNEAADAIRAQNPRVLIGGYTTAFPNFEENNFQRWHQRWKLFMDMSGSRMDFWSIHLYDFNRSWSNSMLLRRGSNLEATFDMLEHYSYLSFNEVKPFVISEYGGRALPLEADPWTPLRDWFSMKSMTSMLLSFSERPQLILSAIPFIIVKAEWGRQADGDPYPWRLMRQNNELPGQTGNHWVYTEMVKFYQLWSEVKGTRIDTRSTDPDIQCNAYAQGNTLYVVLNNLYFQPATVNLKVHELYGNSIQQIRVKHLHFDQARQAPVLEEKVFNSLEHITIGAEGSAVLAYTFASELEVNQQVEEHKYFAREHLTPIITNAAHEFHIDGVQRSKYGEAVLRLGMGRPHQTSLQPLVMFNGHEIEVPSNYMGYDQGPRASWFGVIEIPLPFALLKPSNRITVQFPDKGGHISSMALRVYRQSQPLNRTDAVAATQLELAPASKQLEPGQSYTFLPAIVPSGATVHHFVWTSDNEAVAVVDSLGTVTALTLGQATITLSDPDGILTASSSVEVVEQAAAVEVSSIDISPPFFTLGTGEQLSMQARILPIDASDQSVSWSSSDSTIATIDEHGLVQGIAPGQVSIVGIAAGGLSDTSQIEVVAAYQTFLKCHLLPTELPSDTEYEVQVEYSAAQRLDVAVELKDPHDNWVGEGRVTVEPGQGIATINIRNVSTQDWTTPVYPTPGTGYALRAWIRRVGGDWTTNMGGCSVFDVTITQPTARTDAALAGLRLYPNPGSGRLMLELPALQGQAQLRVFDLMGRPLLQQPIQQTTSAINLQHLPKGMYLLGLYTAEGSITKRIILQ